MNCKNCNAVMRADTEKKIFICPYCESVEPFDQVSGQTLKEELKGIVSEAIRDAGREDRTGKEGGESALRDKRTNKRKATDALITVMQIVFCVFLSIFSVTMFSDRYQAVGFVSLVQLILLIIALINKGKYRRTGKKKAHTLAKGCVIGASVLILVWLCVLMVEEGRFNGREAVWPAQGMGSDLPELPGKLEYAYSSKSEFSASSKNAAARDFADYVESCKKAGYDIDVEASDSSYLAYDAEDNKLEISYWAYSDGGMNVTLSEGIQMGEFQWNRTDATEYVPVPTAEKSYTESFDKRSYRVYVGDVTKDQFIQYAGECMQAGFDGRMSGNRFYGTKEIGENDSVSIDIEFQRNRIMYISIYRSDY